MLASFPLLNGKVGSLAQVKIMLLTMTLMEAGRVMEVGETETLMVAVSAMTVASHLI